MSLYRTRSHGYKPGINYDIDARYKIRLINKEWASSTATWDNLASSYESEIIDSVIYKEGKITGWFSLDATEPVKKMIANPSLNCGFMLFVSHNEKYDGSNGYLNTSGHIAYFLSSDTDIDSLRPKLEVDMGTSYISVKSNGLNKREIPVKLLKNGQLKINLKENGRYYIKLFNSAGRLIYGTKREWYTGGTKSLFIDYMSVKGMIIVNITSENSNTTKKICVLN